MRRAGPYVVLLAIIIASLAVTWIAWPHERRDDARMPLPLVQNTSREDLDTVAGIARERLRADEADTAAALRLAEGLLRQARVEMNAAHAVEAEHVPKTTLAHEPGKYSALKMLGAVYLSQHRLAEAAEAAKRAMAVRPEDAWNYGVLGDAYVELGEYDRAFEAFDTMVRRRPDAAAYARVALQTSRQPRR